MLNALSGSTTMDTVVVASDRISPSFNGVAVVLTATVDTIIEDTDVGDNNNNIQDFHEVILSKAIPMTFIYMLIFVTGMIGNFCTCVVISRNKYMHTATNYYLFSLAVSDLLLLILGLPQEMYHIWVPVPYIFGESFCIIRGLAAEMSTNASILTITAFTIERYMAICHPLRSHTMSKLSRAVKLILVIWIVAAICAIPQAIQFGIVYKVEEDGTVVEDTADCLLKNPLENAFEASTFFFFLLPMTLITIFYVLIALKLRNPGFKTGSVGSSGKVAVGCCHESKRFNGSEMKNGGRPRRYNSSSASSRRAVVKMLVAVVVAFFVCWAPFHAQRLMAIYASDKSPVAVSVYEALTYVSGVLYYVSATINPILYHIMSFKFRMAFKDTLGSCFSRRPVSSRSRNKSNSSYSFNSTVRSRIVTENTETTLETLLREDEPDESGGGGGGGNRCGGGPTPPMSQQRLLRFKNGTRAPVKRTVTPTVIVSSHSDSHVQQQPPQPPTLIVTSPIGGPIGGDIGAITVLKNDSISNSSINMMDDDIVSTPLELSHFMAELNELYDSTGSSNNRIESKMTTTTLPPIGQGGGQNNNGNGYCVSRC